MSFFEETIKSANKFIKTICFIDDQPVFNEAAVSPIEGIDHNLYASSITKAFAPQGKFCAFYQYQRKEEEQQLLKLANESDVSILDWRILFTDAPRPVSKEDILKEESLDGNQMNSDDGEEVVEEKESRGKHALMLIEQILKTNFKSPKVILIYTAEKEIDSIYMPIQRKLQELNIVFDTSYDDLWFQTSKFRIAIYFKQSISDAYISEEVKNKIIAYDNFPHIVTKEFAYLINGLVLKTAIDSIAEVRANTFSLLESYNKNLDPAFLTHKSLLANPHDAEEHLLEIIGSDIKAILKSSTILDDFRKITFPRYIDDTYKDDEYTFEFSEKDKISSLRISEKIEQKVLKSLVFNGVEKTFFGKEQSEDEQIIFTKNCHKDLTKLFVKSTDFEVAKSSNVQFAILTTIKPSYQIRRFILTQGTIVREEANNNHWLCIQPKCDSVRIDTKKRDFLFLRLFTGKEGNFHIVLHPDNPIFFKIDYRVYQTKSFDFYKDEEGSVSSFFDSNLKKFKRGNNLNMIWVAELKNDYAQSISNNFAVALSRVGLDLSEWLRRSS